MRRARPLLLCAALAWLAGVGPASAERLILSLSSHRVRITGNYTGAELVLFGVIERDQHSVARPGPFDVVVTVRGPRGPAVIREKVRLGPIWINLEQRKFFNVPSTLAVLSTRPVDEMAAPDLLKRYGLGLPAALGPEGQGTSPRDSRFTAALIRLKDEQELYEVGPGAVTFVAADLFRSPVPVAGAAPLGTYEVTASLLSGGIELARETTSFEVSKVGFEQTLTAYARQQPWAYGGATVLLALALGWLATVIFRRD